MCRSEPHFIPEKLAALKTSGFRSKFKLSQKDIDYISRKGPETIRTHAYEFICSRVSAAQPKKDGKQTPWRGHPVFVAQHATATCCRGCMAKWHGIEKGRPLTDREIDFIVTLIMAWIGRQFEQSEGRSV